MIRLAIYYTPSPDSDIAGAAAQWLGRRNDIGLFLGQPDIPGIAEARLREITKSPFHYGFHGTVKPPFQLAADVTVEQVAERLEEFAGQQKSFKLPPLKLDYMHDFFCLRPKTPCPPLHDLAAAAVRFFDDFRLPPTPKELEKRRAAGLTPGQEAMLAIWGYPYVLDEFRFHLTLTGRLTEQRENEMIEMELKKIFPPRLCQNLSFDSLSLFIEIDRLPMMIVRRVSLQ